MQRCTNWQIDMNETTMIGIRKQAVASKKRTLVVECVCVCVSFLCRLTLEGMDVFCHQQLTSITDPCDIPQQTPYMDKSEMSAPLFQGIYYHIQSRDIEPDLYEAFRTNLDVSFSSCACCSFALIYQAQWRYILRGSLREPMSADPC